MNNLAKKTILGFIGVMIGIGILIFLPAGTFNYWQGWVFLFIFATCEIFIILYLWQKDRQLLARRISAGPMAEKEKSQKIIMFFASLLFILIFVLSALDHRYLWSQVPLSLVIAGDILIVLGFYIIFVVFRENTFTASTIQVATDQTVISTGPYVIIRHPMYGGALIMLFGTPLALGSWWGLLMFIPFIAIIIWRLLNEEKFLSQNLKGYREYCQRVQFRLIPFIW